MLTIFRKILNIFNHLKTRYNFMENLLTPYVVVHAIPKIQEA